MITDITILSLLGFAGYYLKFKHDEKAKSKAAGAKDIVPAEPEPGQYDEIINDFPTYIRQDGV